MEKENAKRFLFRHLRGKSLDRNASPHVKNEGLFIPPLIHFTILLRVTAVAAALTSHCIAQRLGCERRGERGRLIRSSA